MARINLLPWREELRKEKQKQFIASAGGAVLLMVAVVAYVHMHIGGLIDYQQSRNDFLKQNIREVEAKIRQIEALEKKKEQLIARMQIIEKLQSDRPGIVHLFDELVKAIPDGVFIVNVGQNAGSLMIEGQAESNARVSAFMRKLDTSEWFDEPTLEVIQGAGKNRSFTLKVAQTTPKSETEEKK